MLKQDTKLPAKQLTTISFYDSKYDSNIDVKTDTVNLKETYKATRHYKVREGILEKIKPLNLISFSENSPENISVSNLIVFVKSQQEIISVSDYTDPLVLEVYLNDLKNAVNCYLVEGGIKKEILQVLEAYEKELEGISEYLLPVDVREKAEIFKKTFFKIVSEEWMASAVIGTKHVARNATTASDKMEKAILAFGVGFPALRRTAGLLGDAGNYLYHLGEIVETGAECIEAAEFIEKLSPIEEIQKKINRLISRIAGTDVLNEDELLKRFCSWFSMEDISEKASALASAIVCSHAEQFELLTHKGVNLLAVFLANHCIDYLKWCDRGKFCKNTFSFVNELLGWIHYGEYFGAKLKLRLRSTHVFASDVIQLPGLKCLDAKGEIVYWSLSLTDKETEQVKKNDPKCFGYRVAKSCEVADYANSLSDSLREIDSKQIDSKQIDSKQMIKLIRHSELIVKRVATPLKVLPALEESMMSPKEKEMNDMILFKAMTRSHTLKVEKLLSAKTLRTATTDAKVDSLPFNPTVANNSSFRKALEPGHVDSLNNLYGVFRRELETSKSAIRELQGKVNELERNQQAKKCKCCVIM